MGKTCVGLRLKMQQYIEKNRRVARGGKRIILRQAWRAEKPADARLPCRGKGQARA